MHACQIQYAALKSQLPFLFSNLYYILCVSNNIIQEIIKESIKNFRQEIIKADDLKRKRHSKLY